MCSGTLAMLSGGVAMFPFCCAGLAGEDTVLSGVGGVFAGRLAVLAGMGAVLAFGDAVLAGRVAMGAGMVAVLAGGEEGGLCLALARLKFDLLCCILRVLC